MGFRRKRFHHPLPSKLHGSGFYHDGTFTRENALPLAGHANFANLTPKDGFKRKIKELCKGFPEYQYILTMPGFGPDVSAKVLRAIGDPDRFDNGKQVLKMGGLDLSAERSGKDSGRAIPEISKRGKADLRYALYQAALIASLIEWPFFTPFLTHLKFHVSLYFSLHQPQGLAHATQTPISPRP